MSSENEVEIVFNEENQEKNQNQNVESDEESDVRKQLYYPSNNLFDNVCNAVTGTKYPYLAGTYESMRLYKVMDSTARCNSNGILLLRNEKRNPNPNILYYDNPEQYMKHLKVKISENDVKKWYTRNRRLFGENMDQPFDIIEYYNMVEEGLINK